MIIPVDCFYGRTWPLYYVNNLHYAQKIGRRDLLIGIRKHEHFVNIDELFIDQKTADLIGCEPIRKYVFEPMEMDPEELIDIYEELFDTDLEETYLPILEILDAKTSAHIIKLLKSLPLRFPDIINYNVIAHTIYHRDLSFINKSRRYDIGWMNLSQSDLEFIRDTNLRKNVRIKEADFMYPIYPKVFKEDNFKPRMNNIKFFEKMLAGDYESLPRDMFDECLSKASIVHELIVKYDPKYSLMNMVPYVKQCIKNLGPEWTSNTFGDYINAGFVTPLTIAFFKAIIDDHSLLKKQLANASAHVYFMLCAINDGYFKTTNRALKVCSKLNDEIARKVMSKIYAPFDQNDVEYVAAEEPFLTFR